MRYKYQILDLDNLLKISIGIAIAMNINISTTSMMIMLCDYLVLHTFQTTLIFIHLSLLINH